MAKMAEDSLGEVEKQETRKQPEKQELKQKEDTSAATGVSSKLLSGPEESGGDLVKWLYPGADMETKQKPDCPQQEEMQALTSSSSGGVGGDKEETTPTGGPDSDVGSVDELPVDEQKNKDKDHQGMTEDISQRMTASANYLGSVFSSAWTKTAKTANDATMNSTSFISSALTKVTGSKHDDQEGVAQVHSVPEHTEDKTEKATENDKKESEQKESSNAAMTASSLFTSALDNLGFTSSASGPKDETVTATHEIQKEAESEAEGPNGNKGHHFAFFSTLGKVATDATQTIKDKVVSANMLSEFNKEQDLFIKSNKAPGIEVGLAPWVGYQNEKELRTKILSLSEDRRNFVRAPPSGVTFEFEYSSVSSTALALLQEDPRLQKMRYELVPKKVKEEEFWRNYFYRVGLIRQSFELKDLERDGKGEKAKESKTTAGRKPKTKSGEELHVDEMGQDQDEDFVSESYQASSSDIAEVDKSMKKLTTGGGEAEEWEAELDGELNEFEVVNNKEENPEWENQIQEMLDAEEMNASK